MVEQTIATDDGSLLHVTIQGQGRPLVLCHGGPGLWDYLKPVAESVADLVTTVTWDQRGCGRSSGDGPHTVARYVADLEAIRLNLDLPSWIVGGHSWGATLALMYALAHPDHTDALVYVSGTGLGQEFRSHRRAEQDRRLGAASSRLAELSGRLRDESEEHEYRVLMWSPDFADSSRGVELAASMNKPFAINDAANRELSAETQAWSEAALQEQCRLLDIPVLIVHGERDSRPSWAVDSLASALRRGQLVVLQEVGHFPWMEGGEAFTNSLRNFLSGLG